MKRTVIEPPEFDNSLFDNVKPQALDVFYELHPDTPVYFITKHMGKACPLHYKALVCTYTGWWHGMQGWNVDNKDVESWIRIPGYVVSDFQKASLNHYRSTGRGIRTALTPDQYEEIKNKSVEEIIKMILRGDFNR